jgi:hypothetical protein
MLLFVSGSDDRTGGMQQCHWMPVTRAQNPFQFMSFKSNSSRENALHSDTKGNAVREKKG